MDKEDVYFLSMNGMPKKDQTPKNPDSKNPIISCPVTTLSLSELGTRIKKLKNQG
jgi:hypothetical protein